MITKCRGLLYLFASCFCYLFRPIPISLSAHSRGRDCALLCFCAWS